MMATIRWREVRFRIACASAVSVDVIAFSPCTYILPGNGWATTDSSAWPARPDSQGRKDSSFCAWPSRRAANASERNDEARALPDRPGVAHRAAVFVHQVAHHCQADAAALFPGR